MKAKKQIVDELINSPLGKKLDPNELLKLASFVNIRKLKKDQRLYREDDPSNSFEYIIKGRLKVLKEGFDGNQRLIAWLDRGRLVGELELLDRIPRIATVIATEPTTLLSMSKQTLDKIIEKHPRIGIRILKAMIHILSDHLNQADAVMSDKYGPVGLE